jgi:hypothetical protein
VEHFKSFGLISLFLVSLGPQTGFTQTVQIETKLQSQIGNYVEDKVKSRKLSPEELAVLEEIASYATGLDERVSCKERIAQLSLNRDYRTDESGSNDVIDAFIRFYRKACRR